MHSFLHEQLYKEHGRVEDLMAWQGLSGLISTKDLRHLIGKYAVSKRKMTPEYRSKLSKAKLGNNHGTHGRDSGIRFIGTHKKTGETVEGARYTLQELGFDYNNVSRCAKGQRKSHKGYTWKYGG